MFMPPENIQSQIDSELSVIQAAAAPQVHNEPYAKELLAHEFSNAVQQTFEKNSVPVLLNLDQPPKGIVGDVAIAMFPLSKIVRRSPQEIANLVADSIQTQTTNSQQVEPVGPYVNILLNRPPVLAQVLTDVKNDQLYGTNDSASGEVHVIDYSAPNIAKKLGIQHLPTTVVGESLARISHANGAKTIRINHLGDFGTPFGKVLLGVDTYGFDFDSSDPVGQMHDLYVRINAEAKNDEQVASAARKKFMQLEQGDPRLVALWSKLRELNMNENEKLYHELGIEFDATIGESYFVQPAQDLVTRLVKQGIAKAEGDNVAYVPGEAVMEYLNDGRQIGNVLLRKSDGSTLYATRDLATIQQRVKDFDPSMIEYVVGSEQSEHFIAVSAIAAMSGIAPSTLQLRHTKIGMLAGSGGKKLSSRDGKTQTMDDMLKSAYEAALADVQERGRITDPQEQKKLAQGIARGAISYPILKKDPSANTSYRTEAERAEEAKLAAQIQYAHARATSILEQNTPEGHDSFPNAGDISDAEWRLVKAVMDFPDAVKDANIKRSPSQVAASTAEVAAAFNGFYEALSVKKMATARIAAGIGLTRAAQVTLQQGLGILNIPAPKKM